MKALLVAFVAVNVLTMCSLFGSRWYQRPEGDPYRVEKKSSMRYDAVLERNEFVLRVAVPRSGTRIHTCGPCLFPIFPMFDGASPRSIQLEITITPRVPGELVFDPRRVLLLADGTTHETTGGRRLFKRPSTSHAPAADEPELAPGSVKYTAEFSLTDEETERFAVQLPSLLLDGRAHLLPGLVFERRGRLNYVPFWTIFNLNAVDF